MSLKIQVRRGTKAQLDVITLSAGELGYTTDTKQVFIGDGSTIGSSLIPVGGILTGTAIPSFDSSLHPIGTFFLVNGTSLTGEEDDLYISDGAGWRKVGANQLRDLAGSLDDIADGSTYGKVLLSQLTNGKVNQIDDGVNNVTAAQARSHINASSGVHGVTGDVVGTTDSQSLSNKTLGNDLDANNNKITNLATPTADGDAVNKSYADSLSAGLDPKESVLVATTANITLSGEQTIDGIAVVTGNRVLVKDQSSASENGIYVVASGAWTRATDFDGSPTHEVNGGEYVFVSDGTTNEGGGFVVVNEGLFTGTGGYCQVGIDPITFVQFSGLGSITAGDGLTKTGNTIDVVNGDGSLTVTADDVAVTFGDTSTGELQTVNSNSDGTPDAGSVDKAARIDHKHILDDIDCGSFVWIIALIMPLFSIFL